MTVDQYMQLQDLQKRQQMAAALMNGQPGQQTAPYGGLANAGSSILGAAIGSKARQDQQNMIQQMGGTVPQKSPGWLSGLFNLGGSN